MKILYGRCLIIAMVFAIGIFLGQFVPDQAHRSKGAPLTTCPMCGSTHSRCVSYSCDDCGAIWIARPQDPSDPFAP
jgi:hypothetical protein